MKTNFEMTSELGGFAPTSEFLEQFAALVRADEREACAKLCDVEEETANQETWYQCAKELAKQIRARGKT